ncbi:MAG: glycogen debranching protein GlgX [Desulfocapsa sp.]|nr:glycogen debranching protein GlgX [Desulfocapsa sp.]
MSKKKTPFSLERGIPLPSGATILDHGINFAIFSRHATEATLVIQFAGSAETAQKTFEIELDPEVNRTGDIWHLMLVTGKRNFLYGYRFDGERDISNKGLAYNRKHILLDPLCQNIKGRSWGEEFPGASSPLCHLTTHDFDWQKDRPLKTPMVDSVIYELHVRGFTRDSSSNVKYPGTYLGIIEKIPYLKRLGVTAVELMPVTEWDENDNFYSDPETGEKLKNYWGYNPISFSALKSGFASDPHQHINEFKTMVRSLHQAGIEVILDMVYNHTGEGGYQGNTSSFRGIDNPIFYLLDQHDHKYLNYSGCGNTFNCNHPVVRELIRQSLRYWVMEMHVDGFRFDLASILGRDSKGKALANAPMIEMIAQDPILRDTKIIAEAWDAAGLYQVGSFSTDSRWAEWNGKFRDDVRAFMAGHSNTVANLATRIAGSSDLYQTSSRSPCNSVNFITSHDGFTLYDLVSFEQKHNLKNGEDNRDGDNHNISWNSGVEGASNDTKILELRYRRIRSMALILILSQGVPMITAGDEFGRSQGGNNNCWCQDNKTSWIDWNLTQSNKGLLRFFRKCLELRKTHLIFRRRIFFTQGLGREITWQSLTPGVEDWSTHCHTLAFLLQGNGIDDDFFIMFNGQRAGTVSFTLPSLPGKKKIWNRIIDTAQPSPYDFPSEKNVVKHNGGSTIRVQAMAAVVLQSI